MNIESKAAIAIGTLWIGAVNTMSEVIPSSEDRAKTHNAQVTACADSLGSSAVQSTVLPDKCEPLVEGFYFNGDFMTVRQNEYTDKGDINAEVNEVSYDLPSARELVDTKSESVSAAASEDDLKRGVFNALGLVLGLAAFAYVRPFRRAQERIKSQT